MTLNVFIEKFPSTFNEEKVLYDLNQTLLISFEKTDHLSDETAMMEIVIKTLSNLFYKFSQILIKELPLLLNKMWDLLQKEDNNNNNYKVFILKSITLLCSKDEFTSSFGQEFYRNIISVLRLFHDGIRSIQIASLECIFNLLSLKQSNFLTYDLSNYLRNELLIIIHACEDEHIIELILKCLEALFDKVGS
jgi:hypothetical protein